MEDASTVNRCPRKLVVSFGSIRGYLIETDHGERPQLVHCQGQIELPSRWDRFTTRLGLGKGDKPLLDAVRSAYEFIIRRYAPGDQITLVVNPDTDVYGQVEHFLKAAEMLVRHLHDCTRPPNFFVSDCTTETAIDPISIHAVLVRAPGDTKSISTWSDELKSRFPGGPEHLISWTHYSFTSEFCCCSTSFDLDGFVLSRKVYFIGGGVARPQWLTKPSNSLYPSELALIKNVTNHFIYYENEPSLGRKSPPPVWTHNFDGSLFKSPSADIALCALEEPAGMYHHELQRYKGVHWLSAHEFLLVWKASNKVNVVSSL